METDLRISSLFSPASVKKKKKTLLNNFFYPRSLWILELFVFFFMQTEGDMRATCRH